MKIKGFILAIISACFFGTAGIFVKSGFSDSFSPVDLLMLQYIIATVILFIICFFKYRNHLKLPKDVVKRLFIQGAFGNTLMTVFFYSSFKYLNVAVATMLLYTYPALVALSAFILHGEKPSRTKILSIIGTFAGCILVLDLFNIHGSINYLGVIFALLSACFYAFMNVYAEKIVNDAPSLVITLYTTIFSLLILVIFNFSFLYKLQSISTSAVTNAAMLAFICEIIPLTLLYEAIKYIGSVSTSIISTIELPSAAVIAFLFLGEKLNLTQIAGTLLVIFCVVKLKQEA